MANHGLELGAIDLASTLTHDDGYRLSVLAAGASFGESQAVVRSIVSMLADGSLVTYDRADNRVVTFDVCIEGADGVALQAGEVALRRELYRPNTVTWTPPSDFSAPTVYEVVTSEMSPQFDDIDEMRNRRVFRVTLTCQPHARSQHLTNFATLSVGGSPAGAVIDTCDSSTGWAGRRGGMATGVDSGFLVPGAVGVAELDSSVTSPEAWSLTRTGSINLSTTPYLLTEILTITPQGEVTATATTGSGTYAMELIEVTILDSGFRRYSWVMPAGAPTTLTAVEFSHTSRDGDVWQGLFVRHVARTNLPPGQTARQPSRIITVGGTERTPGSLQIAASNGTSPLNLTLVATWPENGSGFSPPLRRSRTLGNTQTTDTATFSGKREPLGPNYVVHDIPVESLPNGTYQLMALVRATAAGTYDFSSVIQSRHDGVTLGETLWGETVLLPANDWTLVPMGHFRIPIVAAKAGEFRINIKTLNSNNVEYDEAWLFPMDANCALTAVLPTTPRLWLDSADSATRVPQIWEGEAANKSDAHFPTNGVYAMGEHVFTPPRTAIFTATHNVDWPDVTLDYYKRWPSNAAEEG